MGKREAPMYRTFDNWRSRGYIPHNMDANRIQSITIRLHDSVPDHVIQQWQQELHFINGLPAGDPRQVASGTGWKNMQTKAMAPVGWRNRKLRKLWKKQYSTMMLKNITLSHGALCPTTSIPSLNYWEIIDWSRCFNRGNPSARIGQIKFCIEKDDFGFESILIDIFEMKIISMMQLTMWKIIR
jgi:hypothetical protein